MNTSDMPVIVAKGEPRARGRAIGESLRGQIAACMDSLDRSGESLRGQPATEFRRRFLASTGFLDTAKRLAPRLMDEVRGMAEGAGQPFERMVYFQLMDEEWVFDRNAELGNTSDLGHCSGFAALEHGRAIVAQNMDIGQWADGYQAVIRHVDESASLDIQVLTFAGYLGLCGMSRAGPAVCCNTLIELDFNIRGLPVAFVFRSLIESGSVTEAAALCRRLPHASGQNYILGGADGVMSLECSAAQVREAPTSGALGRLCHTNHALANGDTGYLDRLLPNADIGRRCGSPSSVARLASLEARIGRSEKTLDLAAAKDALRAKDDPLAPVCRDGTSSAAPDARIGFTLGSIICEIGPEPALHVAAGPPCRTEYRCLAFDSSGESNDLEALT